MKGIIHAGITVKSLEKSLVFYRDLLGLKLIKQEPVRKARGEKLGVPGAVIQVAVLQTEDPTTTVELIEYLEPQLLNVPPAPINLPGSMHLAFHVENIDKQVKKMKQAGVKFVSEDYEVIKDGPLKGMKWIYFKDPDGTNLELIEYDPPRE